MFPSGNLFVQVKDNTFIRKKVMLVSRSTVDFRSWSLSELLAGKLSWKQGKKELCKIWVIGKSLEQLIRNPLRKYKELLRRIRDVPLTWLLPVRYLKMDVPWTWGGIPLITNSIKFVAYYSFLNMYLSLDPFLALGKKLLSFFFPSNWKSIGVKQLKFYKFLFQMIWGLMLALDRIRSTYPVFR